MDTWQDLVAENERRNRLMFSTFDPYSGKGCPGERELVKISDFPIKKQLMPKKCMKNRELRKIIKRRSIKAYIEYDLGWQYTEEHVQDVVCMISIIRAEEDPAFAFASFYSITFKEDSVVRPFILNYPQRIVLQIMEDMREAGEPIRLIILKARQWGGSTLVQLYIKWMQDFRHQGWNAAIMAHQSDASKRIKAMYNLALKNQPGWTLGAKGKRLKASPFEGSKNDFKVTTQGGDEVRSSVTSVASYENYDSMRSADLKCAHLSEVAYWKKTEGKEPEGVLSSINGTVPTAADTVVVMESSGRSTADFFHDMYQEAKDPNMPSAWRCVFIAFFQIENDRRQLEEAPENFAKWLLDNKDNGQCPEGWREPGRFFWQLWLKGASFEAINWYRHERNQYRTHSYLATEAPSDDVEAFRASGNLIFDKYAVDALRLRFQREPVFVGNIVSEADKGVKAITTARLVEGSIDDGQILRVWQRPDCLKVDNRYVVSVDIGGRGRKSDYTVMTVIDRLGMMTGMGGIPKVVARWRGHIRHDLLAWKAAALAHFYGDAELVIESNTADTEKGKADTEGDHFGTIIDEIAGYYPHLYIREARVDKVTQKVQNVYGFQTNTLTKQYLIDNYSAYIDDQLYDEPDKQCFDELMIYERHEDGTIGNVDGPNNHDDIVMSTGIGLYVSQHKLPLPTWSVATTAQHAQHIGTEADI